MELTTSRISVAQQVATGAVVATLSAVAAHALGVQQLLRRPDLALYLPSAIVGAAIGPTRLRPLLWLVGGPIAALCILVAYTPLVDVISGPLIRRDALPPRVDVIAVLSGGVSRDGTMKSETLDRLLAGIALARTGVARALLISREREKGSSGPSAISDSADQVRILQLTTGLPRIAFIDSVLTTRTEALRAAALARSAGWSTIVVVTSPLHSARACATFEAVGFTVACSPALQRQSSGTRAENRLRAFRSWLYETFATATYRSNGWIH